MTTQDLINAVKAHALANYENDGWDFVVETQEDSDLAKIIGDAKTAEEAIARVGADFKILADYRDDIIGAGGGHDEPADAYEPQGRTYEPGEVPDWARPRSEGELLQEHLDHEMNAQYDYVRESFSGLDDAYEAACDAAMRQEEEEAEAKRPFFERHEWLTMPDAEADALAVAGGFDSAGDCDTERLNRWAEMHSPGGDPAGMLPRPMTRDDYRRSSALPF